MFYRAEGLVPIKPIFVEPLMLHEGAVRSSMLEWENNSAQEFIADEDIRPEDVFFVLSTSGRNPVPIDVALINQFEKIIAFPTHSPEQTHCIWIFFHQILEISPINKTQSLITFKNYKQLQLNISFHTLHEQ